MSRPKLFLKRLPIAMRPLDHAFVAYYADKHGLDRNRVLRELLQAYVRADKRFDTKAFERYVRSTFVSEEEDPDLRDKLLEELNEFVDEREAAGAETARGHR
jgi:hypothetical protein